MSEKSTSKNIIKNRQSFAKRFSDAFLPDWIRKKLFIRMIDIKHPVPLYVSGCSFIHMLSGVLVALILCYNVVANPLTISLVIHTLWEMFQKFVLERKAGFEWMFDVLVDTAFYMMGSYLVHLKC